MTTARPKRKHGGERVIEPGIPFHQFPGDLLLSTARRLGELGFSAALAEAIRKPANEKRVRECIVQLGAEIGMPPLWIEMLRRMNGTREEAVKPPRFRPRLLHGRYTPVVQQVKNLWRWNRKYGWGLPKGWDDQLDVPAFPEDESLVSVNLVAYLEAKDGVLGEHRTFDAYWEIIRTQHPNSSQWEEVKAEPDRLRLLPGITHVPGVRIEVIDHGANWEKANGTKPVDVRSPETSPHAGLLASAANHPRRISKMGCTTVPFEWIAGYQASVPGHGSWRAAPLLCWHRGGRRVHLGAHWGDDSDPDCSVPVLRRLAAGSGTR